MRNMNIKQKYENRDFKNIKTSFGVKQQETSNVLDLYIYDDVKESYYDWWNDEMVGETSAQYFRDVLSSNQNITQINLYINSYGGDVKEGLAIYNQLQRHPANVTVYVDGFACSIASVIAMSGNKIVMGSNTLMMIHRAWTFTWGNPKELRKAADDLEIIDSASTSSYLAKTEGKLSEEDLNNMLDNETWLTADQCLQYGLCTEIANRNTNDNVINALNQKIREQNDLILNMQNEKDLLMKKLEPDKTQQNKQLSIAQQIFAKNKRRATNEN